MAHAAVIAVLLFALSSPQEPGARPRAAWEWTEEERLDARLDPVSIRERWDRAVAEGLTRPRQPADPRQPVSQAREVDEPDEYVVVGALTPELFMPYELFSPLIHHVFADEESRQSEYRERLAPLIAQFAEPKEFWATLEQVARPYVDNLQEERRWAILLNNAKTIEERTEILAEIDVVQRPQCGLRRDAFLAAVESLGRETLYRVLYEGIAPGLSVRSGLPSSQEEREQLLFVERGCR